MKKTLLLLSVIVPSIGYCCPSLEGTWSSSLEKFASFNKQWANVENKPWSYMTQTQGHESINFTGKNEMVISSPATAIKMGNRTIEHPASEERITFDILGCTEKSIALQYKRYGKTEISQLHFENENTYWIYMGAAGSDGNSHIREYYTKSQ